MDQRLSKAVWQRVSAREVMRMARKHFRDLLKKGDPISAYVALANAHYLLVERYVSWWQKPLAAWHLFLAGDRAQEAVIIANMTSDGLKVDEANVVATVLARVPWWLGGRRQLAKSVIERALRPDHWEAQLMKPHTRALMLITLGGIEWRRWEIDAAWRYYKEAESLIPAIEKENSEDREQQLVRVLTAIGFFYLDHAGGELRDAGFNMILEAGRRVEQRSLATRKIRAEARQRDVHIVH